LFWFVNHSPIDEVALNHLNQDAKKSIEIWNKSLKNQVTNTNFSSYQNFSTLALIYALKNEEVNNKTLERAINIKGKLINSEYLQNFSRLVSGNGTPANSTDIGKYFANEVIELLKPYIDKHNGISTNEIISLFDSFPESIHKYISAKFTEIPISSIENKIEKTTRKRKDNPRDADEHGEELYKSTKNDIVLLKRLLGSSNLQLQMLADKVANEVLQCSVDFFNEWRENDIDENFESNLDVTMKLVKLADSVAMSHQVKDRAKENIDTLLEMKNRVIFEAIDFLQSVKNAFETNRAEIRRQVREMEETDIEIKLGYKTINMEAVEENIINSIAWDKVNETLITILSDINLKRIKESDNNELKNNFLKLANWVNNNSLITYVISNIIDKYKKVPPKLPFRILSSSITNTDDKPLYAKFIRYIGLNLNVEVTKDASLTFSLKYLYPNGQINRNSKNSPSDYTLSVTRDFNVNTKSIELSGWGNSDKCTYNIGKNSIEVYVDGYLIHTKSFIVDLAPSEKLEIELKKAEEKLTKIKKTQYFESELETASFEMGEIEKFVLFRSSSQKQMQISEQQKKINYLHKKAKVEKEKLTEQQNIIIYKIKSNIQNADF